MAVVLKFQSTGSIPGKGEPVTMRGSSLTIGRGNENDLVLPDPNRELSKRHCTIEDHNGSLIVVDFSTNGTFLNYGRLALGQTPTPLNDGDILSIGPYELLITIASNASQEAIAAPLSDLPVSPGNANQMGDPADLLDAPGDGGDFLDDILGEGQRPVGPGMVDRSEPDEDGLLPPLGDDDDIFSTRTDPFSGQGASGRDHSASHHDHLRTPQVEQRVQTIPDGWNDDLLSPNVRETISPDAEPFEHTQNTVTGAPDFGERSTTTTSGYTTARAPAGGNGFGNEAARAFLHELCPEDLEISDADLTGTMQRMGAVTRILIEGLREILLTRSSIKSEFGIEHTMIQIGGNNPIKFSLSADQAIEAMLRPKARGFQDPVTATKESLNDVKAHEMAMVSGMEAALRGILKRLNPAVLEEKIKSDSTLTGILKSRKARYWEIYEQMYSEISEQAENDFQELFAKEFARAYKEQMDRLK